MGRIRTTFVKTTGEKIYKRYKDKFTNDFQHNKKEVEGVAEIHSKKLKNVISGYITSLIKKEKSR